MVGGGRKARWKRWDMEEWKGRGAGEAMGNIRETEKERWREDIRAPEKQAEQHLDTTLAHL